MTSSPMCPRTVGETGGLRQRLPSRPKSWSRQSGWPEKRMIITRVTETAQGSNGRATHPRFWSAWELARLVEGSRGGALRLGEARKIPTGRRDTSQGTRFHAGPGVCGKRPQSTVAKCGARVAGSTGSELCPGIHPSPSPLHSFLFHQLSAPPSRVSHVGTSLRSTISHS